MTEKLFDGKTEKAAPLMDLFSRARTELETAVDEQNPGTAIATLKYAFESLGKSEDLFKDESYSELIIKLRADIKESLGKFYDDSKQIPLMDVADGLLGTAKDYIERFYEASDTISKSLCSN